MPRQQDPSKYPSMIGLGNFAHVARLGHSLASSAENMIRTRGDGSEQPPNLDMYPAQGNAREWMDDPSKAPYLNTEVATFSPETLKEFGLDQQDNEGDK